MGSGVHMWWETGYFKENRIDPFRTLRIPFPDHEYLKREVIYYLNIIKRIKRVTSSPE